MKIKKILNILVNLLIMHIVIPEIECSSDSMDLLCIDEISWENTNEEETENPSEEELEICQDDLECKDLVGDR